MESPVPPELSQGQSYHVFCSYSNTDHHWTHALIQQLEDRGLRVCNHERDFTPGRSILENMSESIHQSQKVLLVLSAEFVRSRWCLLEANMSLFKDCLQRKPIVPVLLQRDVSIPLHLSHLTYLDVQSPDFIQQLLRVLCTSNQELQASTVVPYQPPSLYNGKSLEPLPAANEEQLNKFDCGLWSDAVPDQLGLVLQQPERYREAISIINTVSETKVRFRALWKQGLVAIVASILIASPSGLVPFVCIAKIHLGVKIPAAVLLILFIFWMIYKIAFFKINERKRLLRELQKAVGQANSLLFEEKVLMGAQSSSKLLLVYVCVDGCRQELALQSQFHEAMLEYSNDYACCLAKKYFPFNTTSDSGHLEGTVCFCQYVFHQVNSRHKYCSCCDSFYQRL